MVSRLLTRCDYCHGVCRQRSSPMHRGYISWASKYQFSSFSYSHPPWSIIENFLLNFTKNLISDQGPSVEYSARYFNFVFLRFKIYLFMVTPTFLKRTIKEKEAMVLDMKWALRSILQTTRPAKHHSVMTWRVCMGLSPARNCVNENKCGWIVSNISFCNKFDTLPMFN